jgi:hypothetical protein
MLRGTSYHEPGGKCIVNTGENVLVKLFTGEWVRRIVVAVDGDTIYVCQPESYEAAVSRGKEPPGVGFKARWVRREEQHDAEQAAS